MLEHLERRDLAVRANADRAIERAQAVLTPEAANRAQELLRDADGAEQGRS